MTRFLISFPDGAMEHIPDDDWPAVGEAAHAVLREAKAAGVYVHGGGILRQRATVVSADGTVVDGPAPEVGDFVGGFTVLVLPDRDEAHRWAARFAAACRCPQEVRELMDDDEA